METNPPAVGRADPNAPAVASAEPSMPALAGVPTPALGFDEPALVPTGQPVSVAFLPLALAAFVVIAFVLAAWIFLTAGA